MTGVRKPRYSPAVARSLPDPLLPGSSPERALPAVARAFTAVAVLALLGFGALTLIVAMREKSPIVRMAERLKKSGPFSTLDAAWDPAWSLQDLESPPWQPPDDASDVRTLDITSGTVIVHLWATWCEPCRDELADILKLARDYRQKGVRFVLVTYDEGWDAPRELLTRTVGTIPPGVVQLRDPKARPGGDVAEDSLWRRLGATGVPETFIVRDGQLMGRMAGPYSWDAEDIRGWLDAVVAGS